MATEANIPEHESASKTILEEGFSMTENKSSVELSTSNKSPTEYICKSEHCQAEKIKNLTSTKLSEDERQHQTGAVSNDDDAGGDKVEAINEIVHIEESTHPAEKDGEEVSRQACAEEEPMTDQYKSSKVIAESTHKGVITSQENDNTRSKEEDADLECTKQPTSTSQTNMSLINGAPLPNLDLTTKSQGEEDERAENFCAKDEMRDPTIRVEDEVKEQSAHGLQKKKEDMPSLPGPESIGSSDKSENENNTEDASTINAEESKFDAALKIRDNVEDKLENPYINQVTDGVSTQVATEARESLQEVASTVRRDKIKDIFEESRINLEMQHEEERDSQQKIGQEDELREQITLIPEETEVAASREKAKKRVEQNILPVEEFEERGEKDEPTSPPDRGETSLSTEKTPPVVESITKIGGNEHMIPQKTANDFNSTNSLNGKTGKQYSIDIYEDSRVNSEKHQEEKRDSQPKIIQEDQLREQVTLIPEETETAASREDAEKRVEQNILPVEEFEERGEKDEPTSIPDSRETSISTEKIPPLAESITKIKGEENTIPQKSANDLNSTDPLVGETGQPDNTGEVPKTEAQEEYQESSKYFFENNEQDEHPSETHSTENLVLRHMDSEAMMTTETLTELTKDTEEPQKVPDSHSKDEIGIKGGEKIVSEETIEGEETINKQLFAAESVPEDENPSKLRTVASARDETTEQSSHEESPKDGEITLIKKNESQRPKYEAGESKREAEVFDLPNTRGGQDIYEKQITEGSVEETLNNLQENEKQIQNMRDNPHEEIKGENHVSNHPTEFIQNTGLEEGYSIATHLCCNPNECFSEESKSSVDSSSLDKPPTENICDSDHQILTKSENGRQHQNAVEATEEKIIEEHQHDIEDDGAKISKLASIDEPNPKVHEEDTSIDHKHLDQQHEFITDKHATIEVILESTEREMITSQTNEDTTSKRDEDADSECNQQATSIFEKYCINNEDIDTAMHVQDEFKEIITTGFEKTGQVREVDQKDPESIRSSDMSEHENNEEFKQMTSGTEDASTVTVAPSPCIHSVEESTFEAPSNNEDNDKEKLENLYSSLVADRENTQAATEAGETMVDASNATCQDNKQDICDSARQEVDVNPDDDTAKAEDLACQNRDIREHEENIQTGLPDNTGESKIDPETHDGEKKDLDHKNEQEQIVREQAHPILENTEKEASRENDEKRMEQNIYSAEDIDVKESTSEPITEETSISTEKSLSLVESISEINNEERISPQQIANNLNTNGALVEETGQPDICDIVSKTNAPEEHQKSSEFRVEHNKHEHHPETESTENLIIKQVDPIVTKGTVSESIKDIEEIKKFRSTFSEEQIDIEEDEKILPEESEREEATGISEDQAPSRLLTTTLIRDEVIEQSTMEESLGDSESTLIEKNESYRAENDAEEKIKPDQASEPSEANGSKDIYGQQIMEGSIQGTTDKFQENEKETEDTSTEIRGGNYDTSLPSEVNQNTELEERRSMTGQLKSNPNICCQAELESSVESSCPEKSQTKKMFESEQLQADKAEAINDISKEEPDHDIEHDSAKSSMLASTQKPDLKVHEEETSIDNSNLDQHLEVLTDQHASSEVIPENVGKEMITSRTNESMESKREEDTDLECNEQVTRTYEITLGKISEASLPNLELGTKSRSEEDGSVTESLKKDEGIETTKHVEDESNDLSLIETQNMKAEIAFVPDGEQKDPESIRSSNKLEHENNREGTKNILQIPYVQSVEGSISQATSKNRDNAEDNRKNPSSNPVTDVASPQAAIEAVETLKETTCKDKDKYTCESVGPEEDAPLVDRMVRAEDSPYIDRDAQGANEEDTNHAGLTETIEDSRTNPKTHDDEKRDSLQKNDQEYEHGERAVLIIEQIEEEAPREMAEKRIEQDTHSVGKFEEQEKSEPTSSPDSGETLISTEKSLPLAESTIKINNEETIFPENIVSDLNTKDPLVEDSCNFNIDEAGKETQTKAQGNFEDSSKTCTENDKQDEQRSEAQSVENLAVNHLNSEEMLMTNTGIKSAKETKELDKVPESLSQEKIDIKDDEETIIPKEPKVMEETTGVSENEALSRLPRTASVGEEIEHNFQEESLKDGASMIHKNENCIPENDAEKDKKAVQAFDLPETNGRQDINEKQVIEESVEETMKSFRDIEMKVQILIEDTRREIEEKSSVSSLPSALIQYGKTVETILCELNETVENPEILGTLSKKEEQILFGEYGNPIPKEGLIENQDECAYSMKVDDDKAQLSRQKFGSFTYTEGEETCVQLEKFSQKEKVEEEPKDVDGGKENKASHQEVRQPSETEVSALKPGEIERTAGALSSATVGMDTRKECMEEVECNQTKIKEEVDVTESEGQIEATSSIERKISNPLDDFSKPKEDHDDVLTTEENNTLVKGPSSILGAPKKDSSSTNESEAEFPILVNENTAMKEVKPGDVYHLEGSDVAHEMMDVTTETRSNCLGGDIAERQEAKTNSEDWNIEVKEVIDQGEQISQEIEGKDLITGINHEITDSSMVPSYGEPKTAEMNKTTKNAPDREDVSFVETETSSITHIEGALTVASLANEKGKEYSNEGIQKHNDEDQLIPPDLKSENITLESDTGHIVRENRQQVDGLADLNKARKLEIVEDEKSTIEVTKTILQEDELTAKTEDSSAVTGVEREAELNTATSGSQEECLNTKSGELLMKKGDFLAKDQSEEILLHSNNTQTEKNDNNLQDKDTRSVQEVPASNLKPRCNNEDLLNSSLDQDGNINAIKLSHEDYQRSGMADNNESVRKHPTEGTITSPGEETENEVEVSTFKLTEQAASIKLTEGEKPLTSDNQTEQNMEITDVSALKSSDASETNTDDSSSTPKVYQKETEASFIKKDDSATDEPKIVPVIVETEEKGLKNSRTGHIEDDRGSVIVSENEGETAITTDKTRSDSTDTVGRGENFNSEKEEILEELNEGNLKMGPCVTETDKTTTVQQEREQPISTISISQDYPAPLAEEKATMENSKIHPTDAKSTREEIIDGAAETYLVHSMENTLPEKEHEVVKPGGTSDVESVNITEESSNGDSSQHKNKVNEEKVLVEASECPTNRTREDSGTVQGQDSKDTTLEGSLTNVAIEKEEIALENEPTDELPPEKTVEAADANEKVELTSESTAEDQRGEKIYQAMEKNNCEDNVLESTENVPYKKIQGGIEREVDMQIEIEHHVSFPRDADAAMLGGCTGNDPAATEMASGSENILEPSPEPTSNLKESDALSACYETDDKATATNSGLIEQRGGIDSVEERESRISENLAKANEDFSFTTIEASDEGLQTECDKENKAEISNEEGDTHTFESLPCMHERNDVTTVDKGAKTSLDIIDTDNIQEERSSLEDGSGKKSQERAGGGREMGQETKDEDPTTGDETSATEYAIKNSSVTCQIVSNENQHEEKSEATEEGECDNIKSNLPDEKDGKDVAEVATEPTHENRGTEPKITDRRTEVMAQGEKDHEVEADNSHKEHTDTAEVSESTREIQQLEESSLGEVDIKATVKADAEIRETNEDIEQGLLKPAGGTNAEVLLEKAKSANITVKSTRVGKENISSSTREIQKLEESSLGEADIKTTVKADTEIREMNEDTELGLHKPDGEIKPEVQLEKEKSTNITVESTRREIQELEESSLREVNIKATGKADTETREANGDIKQGLHKPDGDTKAEVQLEKAKSTNITVERTRVEKENVSSSAEERLRAAKHLDEATDLAAKAENEETPQCEEAKAESEEDEGVNDGNDTMEPLPSGASVMVEAPKDGEDKVKHKKSHNILSGVGSKVKHSISKVKKAITGKSSHPKTSSPK